MKTESNIIKQRTDKWYKARLGKFTASNFVYLMAKPADKSALRSKTAITYIRDLAIQLFLNEYTNRQNNDATPRGMRHEESALRAFSKSTGFKLDDPGFLVHEKYPEVGATPDAAVIKNGQSGLMGLVQVKCPNTGQAL